VQVQNYVASGRLLATEWRVINAVDITKKKWE
jgi:hypothetical protein